MTGKSSAASPNIRRLNREARRCLASNDLFVAGRQGGFSFRRRNSVAAEEVLSALLPDPDLVLEQGQVLAGRGNSCRSALVKIDGRPYVLKRYDRRGLIYSLRHVFRRSRALRTWLAAWSFRGRGFGAPDPLLCIEERRFRTLGRSYLLSEFIGEVQRLSDLWPTLEGDEKREVLAQSAKLFADVHRSGLIHGDTNWDNILVGRKGKGYSFHLVDFDCSRIYPRLIPARAHKDIQHFLRHLDWLEPGVEALRTLFVECWQRNLRF